MDDIVISVENLSKKYDLGVIGTGTFSKDLNRWWARMRRQPDPYAKIGQVDHGNRLGQTILALDDVSFTVKRGEVLGIIGRNGAGKSTLLKILSQVTAPSSGRVKIKGRIGSLLEVGTGFHPELTGRENLYLNGAILGMSKAEVNRKFDEIVDFSGVEKFIDTPVKRYSSGMYVRLAFAVAAHLEPEILIIDEVLAVGDAEFQKKCLGKMGDVAKGGRTVLFVSHNMTAIEGLCKSCAYIKKGGLDSVGDPKDIIRKYLTEAKTQSDENNDGIYTFNHRNNQYNNKLLINSLTILDKNDQITNQIFMGEKVSFEIALKNMKPFIGAQVGIMFTDDLGKWLGAINTGMTGTKLPNQDCLTAKLTIDNFPFTPGTYGVDLSVAIQGSGRLDAVFDAVKLFVYENDIYKSGVQVSNYFGNIYINGEWIVNPATLEN